MGGTLAEVCCNREMSLIGDNCSVDVTWPTQ